jgi:hypothetical protein
MARDEAFAVQSALAQAYAPEPKIRVGILLIAGALSTSQGIAAVDATLMAAGHAPRRRRAQLQPRTGEKESRVTDVIEFLTLYGHEYAAVAFRTWPAAHGHESELTAATKQAGCRTIWELRPGDPDLSFDAVGSGIILR